MVGILYCNKSTLDYKEIEKILLANGIETCCIAIEEATAASFDRISVIINAMDSFFPESKIGLLVDFFNSGRNILNLSATPFTVNADDGKANNRVLRSFGIVDDFCPIPESSSYVKTSQGEKLQVQLTGFHGAVYHLCEQTEGGNIRGAYLEHILEAFDRNDQLIATPIIRVVTHNKGSMSFWGFNLDTAMLQEEFWKKLFMEQVKKELIGNVLVSVDSAFARYYPDEPKNINIKLENINAKPDVSASLSISVYDSNECLVFEQNESVSIPYETSISPELLTSSLYRVVATVTIDGVTITEKKTGFLVISDEEITDELKQFKPMYIDETVSNDFCLVDGKITAILGTTYFVTDVYRECFYYMNAWLCAKEMAQLKEIGFNVLRSGNWSYVADFYNADGSICERGKRALQTYFLLAARNGFTVQFALGHVMLNQWNTDLSPIHNKQMREKCMTYVRSFADSFKSYPNVALDIVNEPSYSNRGAWSTGRPSAQEGELIRYQEWLSNKYNGKPEQLRAAWGESAATLNSFDDVTMPDMHLFSRGLCRTEQRYNHTPLADFYAFSREEFLAWTTEVRANIKKLAPNMLVMMGRDENLRVPEQQAEVLAGNTDMVCWHQWNYNSNIITEYLLNRVRGKICVAQEMGMYRFDDIRSGKRHTDDEIASRLEKKLLYAFGNFVQWQAHDDPFMHELSENSLGLYRADLSPTPALQLTKNLIAAEKNMQSYMYHRQDDKVKIATVYSTSYHYGVDNSMAQLGIKNHVYALYNCLKEQSNFMLEHLFRKENASAIGTPNLLILPAMQMLNKDAWSELLEYVKKGSVLLVNGCIDKDEFFAEDVKIGKFDDSYTTRKLMNFEKLTIDGKEYSLDFRPAAGYADVSNLFNCGQVSGGSTLTHYTIGNGTIIYCPYPIELSSNYEAVCACYEYAIAQANAQNAIYKLLDGKPNIVFTATSYENCTVYTLINEGFADTVTWTDLRSGKTLSATVKEDCGGKLWLSDSGEVLQVYGAITV